MDFNDMIGQRIIVESLRNAVKNNMITNGYIFSGPKGCGKKLMAYIFSMALNCSCTVSERPCGSCSSCIRTSSGNHPNLEIVKPTGQSIKIKQIRQIISDVAKKSFESGYKIIIIENAEKMTHDAQDAFLKTLEEPPANTVFLMLAENHNLLLPTIVSRCQVYQFKPVDAEEMKNFIEVRYDYAPMDVETAVMQSNGVVGKALELLKDKEGDRVRTAYISILDKALTGNGSEALLLASEVVANKEEAEKFLEFSLAWFRDVMVFGESQGEYEHLIINIDSLEILCKHNSVLTGVKLNSIIDIIKKMVRYVKHNVGIKNSIDGMLFNIAEVSSYNGENSWSKI
ncbi:MAG: DNA polymerase III subunit delta' [Clostridiaceae bacterium]|nr:DNA polymerase III subunit delta' [Clostridiaceae bacterium]